MTQKTYHITNPIEWLSEAWPVPSNSLVFWCHQNAGGVLLFEGIHYIETTVPGQVSGQYAFSIPGLAAGDIISVVTF